MRRATFAASAPILSVADARWLAGVIDACGALYLAHGSTPTIEVSTRRRALVAALYLVAPSPVHREISRTDQTRHRWRCRSVHALAVLRQVRPYLRARQAEADVLLAWPTLSRGQRPTAEQAADRARLAGELSYLDTSADLPAQDAHHAP